MKKNLQTIVAVREFILLEMYNFDDRKKKT
jgi:hypothetical protein